MVTVTCFTNLDLKPCEEWPRELPCRPVVGDKIRSSHNWGSYHEARHLTLEVVSVTFEKNEDRFTHRSQPWICRVELHLPKSWSVSIHDFQKTYYPQIQGVAR